MKINKAKCTITGINFCNTSLTRMAGDWGCPIGVWPTVYLGLPLGGNPRAVAFWDPVVEKVEKRVQNWKKACLSKGGRLTLIQAVLCSLPSYYMSLFRMPAGVVARVEKLIRGFLWEGFDGGKRVSLVNWTVTGLSKELGGLGVGFLKVRNDALRAKWLWRFPQETNSLWHRVIKSKYGVDANGWDSKVVSTGTYRNPWRDISDGYTTFLQCCRFVVGRGDRIRFWEDLWVKEGILKELYPRLYRLSDNQSMSITSFRGLGVSSQNWDFGFRRPLNDYEAVEVSGLLHILGGVTLTLSKPDCRRWEIDVSGQFSCKSYRNFLLSNINREAFPPFAQIWKTKAPPKVKVLVWLVALRKINTCDLMQKRRPFIALSPYWCMLCKRNLETADHLFVHCPYTIEIWWKLMREFQISWVVPKGCFEMLCIHFVIRGKRKRAKVIWGCLIHAVMWNIWLERNRRVFNNSVGVGPDEIWERAKFGASLWASVSAEFREYHYSTILHDFNAVLV